MTAWPSRLRGLAGWVRWRDTWTVAPPRVGDLLVMPLAEDAPVPPQWTRMPGVGAAYRTVTNPGEDAGTVGVYVVSPPPPSPDGTDGTAVPAVAEVVATGDLLIGPAIASWALEEDRPTVHARLSGGVARFACPWCGNTGTYTRLSAGSAVRMDRRPFHDQALAQPGEGEVLFGCVGVPGEGLRRWRLIVQE